MLYLYATNQSVDCRNRISNQKQRNCDILLAINEKTLFGRIPEGISKREVEEENQKCPHWNTVSNTRVFSPEHSPQTLNFKSLLISQYLWL